MGARDRGRPERLPPASERQRPSPPSQHGHPVQRAINALDNVSAEASHHWPSSWHLGVVPLAMGAWPAGTRRPCSPSQRASLPRRLIKPHGLLRQRQNALLVVGALSGEVAGQGTALTPLCDLFAAVLFDRPVHRSRRHPAALVPALIFATLPPLLQRSPPAGTPHTVLASRAPAPGGPEACWSPRGEFSSVVAGLAVGVESRNGPVGLGLLTARWTEPMARRLIRRPASATPATAHEAKRGDVAHTSTWRPIPSGWREGGARTRPSLLTS